MKPRVILLIGLIGLALLLGIWVIPAEPEGEENDSEELATAESESSAVEDSWVTCLGPVQTTNPRTAGRK